MRCCSGMVPCGEELFHEFVFAFGDQFDQRLVGGFGGNGSSGGGDLGSISSRLVAVGGRYIDSRSGFMVTRSTTPRKYVVSGIAFFEDGELHGERLAPTALMEVVNEGGKAIAAAGFGVVHLVDDDDAGDGGFFSVAARRARRRYRFDSVLPH